MIIAAVDPSLTGTGTAVLDAARRAMTVGTIVTKGVQNAPERDSLRRIRRITAETLARLTASGPPALTVIEAPAFSKSTGMAHERSGLWWVLYAALHDLGTPVLVIKPNLRAKYATGSGTAGKDAVMLAAAARYAALAYPANNNESDAIVLAAMGARIAGLPIEDRLPTKNLDALKTIGAPDAPIRQQH